MLLTGVARLRAAASETMERSLKQVRTVLHQSVHSARATIRSYPRFWFASAVGLTVLAGATCFATQRISSAGNWTQVYTNGHYVGLVPRDTHTLDSLHEIANAYNVNLTTVPINTAVPSGYDWKRIAALPTQAMAIVLNGQALVYTSNQSSAERVLRDVKRTLTPSNLPKGAQVTFAGNVSIEPATVGVAEILSPTTAERMLVHPVVRRIQGRSEGLLSGRVANVLDNLQPSVGKPAVSQATPVLHVRATVTVTKNVSLAYPVHYIKDNHMAQGQTKVVTRGKPGAAREQVQLQYVDGKLVGQAVLNKEVIRNSQAEVDKEGTNSGMAAGSWGWPSADSDITSGFGWRTIGSWHNFHPGIDIGCPIGTPVYATNNGTVEEAGWNSGGYGNWALVNNGNGIETVFGHMSHVVVHPGQVIAKGDIIGYSGATGNVTGPHLHYEVRINGTPVAPMPYM